MRGSPASPNLPRHVKCCLLLVHTLLDRRFMMFISSREECASRPEVGSSFRNMHEAKRSLNRRGVGNLNMTTAGADSYRTSKKNIASLGLGAQRRKHRQRLSVPEPAAKRVVYGTTHPKTESCGRQGAPTPASGAASTLRSSRWPWCACSPPGPSVR